MRAAVVPEPGRVELVSVPEPVYSDYEALVEVLTCSICSGTDTHIIYNQFPWRAYPCILGHESIGRVVACGPAVRSFGVGDLVLRPACVRPGETLGGYNSMFGGFAELGIVADGAAMVADTPRGQTPKLPAFALAQQVAPPDFNPDLAGALITFKETLSFLQRLGVQAGRSLLILGSGTVGLSFTLAAKLVGAYPVLVTGRRPEPLEAARRFGADVVIDTSQEKLVDAVRAATNGAGAAFAVEAVGDWEVLQSGIRALANDGQIGIYGVASTRTAQMDWSQTPGNWALRFIQPKEEEVHDQVLSQMRLGLVDVGRLVSHTVAFAELSHGIDLVRQKQATKVVVRIKG
jgi:threonine dehydrogenase-like Zn-dependent dehydrogenase